MTAIVSIMTLAPVIPVPLAISSACLIKLGRVDTVQPDPCAVDLEGVAVARPGDAISRLAWTCLRAKGRGDPYQ